MQTWIFRFSLIFQDLSSILFSFHELLTNLVVVQINSVVLDGRKTSLVTFGLLLYTFLSSLGCNFSSGWYPKAAKTANTESGGEAL